MLGERPVCVYTGLCALWGASYKAHTRIEENMTTRNEQRLITRLDKARDNDPRAKFAHLFKARTTNAFTLRVLGAYQDAKIAAKAAGR